ncbi:MAG: hypothetical protein AB1589_37270 [Cyanobacteriota bacterium]
MSFSRDGKQIVAIGDKGMVQLWRVEDLDELLKRGCRWLHGYLQTNPNVDNSDCKLCNEIGS